MAILRRTIPAALIKVVLLVVGIATVIVLMLTVFLPGMSERGGNPTSPIAVRLVDSDLQMVFVGRCPPFWIEDLSVRVGSGMDFDGAAVIVQRDEIYVDRLPLRLSVAGSDLSDPSDAVFVTAALSSSGRAPTSASPTSDTQQSYSAEMLVSELSSGSTTGEKLNEGRFDELVQDCAE